MLYTWPLALLIAAVVATDSPPNAASGSPQGSAESSKSSTAEYYLSAPVLTIKQTFPGKKVHEFAFTEALREAIRQEELRDTATSSPKSKAPQSAGESTSVSTSDAAEVSALRSGKTWIKGPQRSTQARRPPRRTSRAKNGRHQARKEKTQQKSPVHVQPEHDTDPTPDEDSDVVARAKHPQMPQHFSSDSDLALLSDDDDDARHFSPPGSNPESGKSSRSEKMPISEYQLQTIRRTAMQRRERYDQLVLQEALARGEPDPFDAEGVKYKPRKSWHGKDWYRKYRLALQRRVREKRRNEAALQELVGKFGEEEGTRLFSEGKQAKLNAKRLREINLCASKQIGRQFHSLAEYNKYRMAGGQSVDRRSRSTATSDLPNHDLTHEAASTRALLPSDTLVDDHPQVPVLGTREKGLRWLDLNKMPGETDEDAEPAKLAIAPHRGSEQRTVSLSVPPQADKIRTRRPGRPVGTKLDAPHSQALHKGRAKFIERKRRITDEFYRENAPRVGLETHEQYDYRPRSTHEKCIFERRKRKAYNNRFNLKVREREILLNLMKQYGDAQGQEELRQFKERVERMQLLPGIRDSRRRYPEHPDADTESYLMQHPPDAGLKKQSKEYKLREQLRACNRDRVICGWNIIPNTEQYKRLRERKEQAYPPKGDIIAARVKLQLAQGKLGPMTITPRNSVKQ